MRKYKMGLLTKEVKLFDALCEQLNSIFQGTIDIVGWCLETEKESQGSLDVDFAISTNQTIIDRAKKTNALSDNTETCIITRTINLTNFSLLEKILCLTGGTKVAICTNMIETSEEIVHSLETMGIKHLQLIPYCRNHDVDLKDVELALTFGFPENKPPEVQYTMDLGMRILDTDSILKIVQSLNIDDLDIKLSINKYVKAIVSTAYNLASISQSHKLLNNQLNSILGLTVDGFLVINKEFMVTQCNDLAMSAIGYVKYDDVINKKITSISPMLANVLNEIKKMPEHSKIVSLNNTEYYVELHSIEYENKSISYIILLRKLKSIQSIELNTRAKLHKKNFSTKYCFSNIVSNDQHIKELIEYAKRASVSGYNIAIYGESGTGKEVFAQAIHSFSNRHDGLFVPVNINALQDNLIESELFGYDGGSFTGAKKEGKPGLFEIAHNGTLFLDEIGDLSLPLQAKLLRVIQEREIIRVGGINAIPINTRLIVATNNNLLKMVEDGSFRKDLYFRINVLPIHIPPLNMRPKDIPLLLEHFLSKKGLSLSILSKEVKDFLLNYQWPGNVRELENVCTYISCFFDVSYPNNNLKEMLISYTQGKTTDSQIIHHFDIESSENFEIYKAILLKFYSAKIKSVNLSQKTLHNELLQYTNLSARQLRKLISNLKAHNLIEIGKTKQGTSLTKYGLNYIRTNFEKA